MEKKRGDIECHLRREKRGGGFLGFFFLTVKWMSNGLSRERERERENF